MANGGVLSDCLKCTATLYSFSETVVVFIIFNQSVGLATKITFTICKQYSSYHYKCSFI